MKTKITKFIKLLFLSLIIFSPIGISYGFSVNNSEISIVGSGSSSVKSILDSITEKTNYSPQYIANGSAQGFESQMKNTPSSAFGMISSWKYPTNKQEKNYSKKNKIKTIGFAIDAIGIVINLPKGIKYKNNIRPKVDIKELSKLYDKDPKTKTTWRKLLKNIPDQSYDLDKEPIAYGREGGVSSSGTSEGFWHTLKNYMNDNSFPDLNHKKILKKYQTPESNSQSLKILQNQKGSLTYISLGYALKNETPNSLVATITNVGKKDWIPSIENVINESYKWVRSFNVIYSTKNKKSINFVKLLLSPKVQKIISNNNFILLNKKQIHKQKNNLNTPDYIASSSFKNCENIGLGF